MQMVAPAAMQLAQQLHHRFAVLRVEVAGRLVGEQDRRVAGHRPRHRDALLLAARELRRDGASRGAPCPPARAPPAPAACARPTACRGRSAAARRSRSTVRSPIRLKLWKMNPISRLRTRARSRSGRSATGLPFEQVLPSVGVSSSPRIESSVDLPQPDGPAMATYSPLLDLEVDAGERVGLDLVGEEDLRDAVELDQGCADQCSS